MQTRVGQEASPIYLGTMDHYDGHIFHADFHRLIEDEIVDKHIRRQPKAERVNQGSASRT